MPSKKERLKEALRIVLSKFASYLNPKVELEQYITPTEVVLDWFDFLWELKNRKNLTSADFGAGTGRLTAMLAFLGFKEIYAIEKDKDAFLVLNYNIKTFLKNYLDRIHLINDDLRNFNEEVDVVVSNPPFGSKRRGQDRIFIGKSLQLSKVAYMLANPLSLPLYEKLAEEWSKKVKVIRVYKFRIERQYPFHRLKEKTYKVALCKIF